MTSLGIALVWCAVRLTVLAVLIRLLSGRVARRAGPAPAAAVVLAGLMLAVPLTALGLSAWPSWWVVDPVSEAPRTRAAADRTGRVAAVRDVTSTEASSAASAARHETPSADLSARETGRTTVGDLSRIFWDQLRRPGRDETSGRRWAAALGLVFLAAVTAGAVRFVISLCAVRGYQHPSRPIADPQLHDEIAILRAEMECVRSVDVRESPELDSAATVGWRRPLLLLPAQWRQWTETERRVVLAHELAHICRRDYLAWLAAQCSVVLNFYHPLAHWLARELRLQQELAADAWGAKLAGGPRSYLTTLAQLALRQEEQPISLAARSFLPTRGMFLWRIEMLRRTKVMGQGTVSWRAAIGGLVPLAALALLLAGVRGPDALGSGPAAAPARGAGAAPEPARGPAAQAQPANTEIELRGVPHDASLVIAIRPGSLVEQAEGKRLVEVLDTEMTLKAMLGISVGEVDQFTLVLTGRGFGADYPGMVLRARKPHDWKPLAAAVVPGATEVRQAGQTYYRAAAGGRAYFRPDDRSIVVDSEANLAKYFGAGRGGPAWAAEWKRVARGQFAVAIDVTAFREELGAVQRNPSAAPLAGFAPLWEEARVVVAGANFSKGLTIQLNAVCGDEAGAGKVAETAGAAITFLRNILGQVRGQVAGAAGDEATVAKRLLGIGDELLQSVQVKREQSVVSVQASSATDAAAAVATLLPAVTAAREAARRTQSRNNLKQIALAMHNYHDAQGCFPPAVLYGPDGKTPYSWRVALLPYLDQGAQYQQYRFDEPWDGPNNRKLLAQVPPVLRCSNAAGDPSHTSYFVLTGPDTVFSGAKGKSIRDIVDGTSNTVLAVESNLAVPWTKPEDIVYDATKPLPKFGGLYQGGFNTALCDGAVRFISSNVDEKSMRALITAAGAEVIGGL
jgi:beta-lactamase regulating signal transducer with metallopeptidase domain